MGGMLGFLARSAGVAAGVGIARQAVERLGGDLRPALKTAVRLGLDASDRVGAWTAEARENLDDLVAEARAERDEADGR